MNEGEGMRVRVRARSKVSPSFANTFVSLFEKVFIYLFHKQPLIYLRCINDVLMLWHHDEKFLNECFNQAKTCHESMKFPFHYSKQTVKFLDFNIKLKQGALATSHFTIPTDKRQLLHCTHLQKQHTIQQVPPFTRNLLGRRCH